MQSENIELMVMYNLTMMLLLMLLLMLLCNRYIDGTTGGAFALTLAYICTKVLCIAQNVEISLTSDNDGGKACVAQNGLLLFGQKWQWLCWACWLASLLVVPRPRRSAERSSG